jgi:hypothetical protein
MHISLYVVTNLKNGKQYVGMTSLPVQQRWQLHISEARSGGVRIFCRALRKYTPDGFDWQEVATAIDPEAGAAAERELIAVLQPAYNMTAGGEGAAGMHPEAKARKAKSLSENWDRTYDQRCASLQEAADRTDQVSKGKKISTTKKQSAEKTREQAKARVAADGGAQMNAARAARWSKPGARERFAETAAGFQDEAYRARARMNATLQHAIRRGELGWF